MFDRDADYWERAETIAYALCLVVAFTLVLILPFTLFRAVVLYVLVMPSYEFYEFADGLVLFGGTFKYGLVVLIAGLSYGALRHGVLYDSGFAPDPALRRRQFLYQFKHHAGAFMVAGFVSLFCVAYFLLAQNENPTPSFRRGELHGGIMASSQLLSLLAWAGYWVGRKFHYERLRLQSSPPPPPKPVRGERLLDPNELNIRLNEISTSRDSAADTLPPRQLCWGGLSLPETALGPHYVVIGNTGSGKTLSIRLLMQGVLGSDSKPWERGTRAVVYDPKRELYPILVGMGVPADLLHVMNPFDTRCEPWDIATDITDEASAVELAKVLAPEDEHAKDKYWPEVARECITAVLLTLIKRSRATDATWTLRDVVEICTQRKYFESVLNAEPDGRRVLDNHFRQQADHTVGSIVSTFSNKLSGFRQIAALWDSSSLQPLSLTEWMSKPGVLLLGNSPDYPTVTEPLNRVILERVEALIRTKRESTGDDETWLFIDEVRGAGKFEGLSRLLTEGRSKGAHIVLGFQDREGFESVYGEKVAREMIGQCDTRAFLRLGNPDTSEYASRTFGQYEDYKVSQNSGSDGKGHETWGETRSLDRIDAVLPQQLMNLKPATSGRGFEGFYVTPELGRWGYRISAETLTDQLAPSAPGSGVADFIPRPKEHQELQHWGSDDFERFGIELLEVSTKTAVPEPKTSATPSNASAESASLLDW